MELSKKTTILFSPQLHNRLAQLASEKHVSLGELVRSACEKEYGLYSDETRLNAVRRLAKLDLPVDETCTMKEQSVPTPEDLSP